MPIAGEQDDAGGSDRNGDEMRQQQHVEDVLWSRFVGRARRRVQEPVHACPPVTCLPDQIRNEERGGNPHGNHEAVRPQHVTAPHEERRNEQREDDGERVLRLEPNSSGQTEQRPRAVPEREPEREPEHDHRGELVERDRLEEAVRRNQER